MTWQTVHEFGTVVLSLSAVALWVVLALRVPSALRSRQQRMLWLAGLGMAGSITVYLDPVTALLKSTALLADSCDLFMNIWGVFSSALILDFVLAAMSRRRAGLVYGLMVVVSGALIVLDRTIDPSAGCVTSVAAPWYSPFWWLLITAHLVAVIPCAVLCGRHGRRAADDRPVRTGLLLLAAGFTSSAVFWAVCLVFLLLRPPWLGALFGLNIGITGWLIAAGLSVPVVIGIRRWIGNITALWSLWPLWRDLVADVPHVALSKPRSRVADLLGGVGAGSLALYRRVVEIRDAILVLRDYADVRVERQARQHVCSVGPAEADVEPMITACWLEYARTRRRSGAEPGGQPPEFSLVGGRDLPGEVAFLRAVQRARAGSLIRGFGAARDPAGERRETEPETQPARTQTGSDPPS